MRDEKDDFWDIASLLPPKKKTPSMPYGEVLPPVIEDEKAQTVIQTPAEERKLHFDPYFESEEESEYTPKDNPLITKVRVLRKKSHMHLFHGFRAEGAAWLAERGTPCKYVPYFSFVPQYNQLNLLQKAYYLYFRDEANAGNYLDAGQSYVLLYIYEILNLPEYIPPKIGILRLAKVWAAYRSRMPAIDRNMIMWLADYALLHGLSCPRSIILPFLSEVLQRSSLKEFYLGLSEDSKETVTDALILLTANYKYQNSRYAQGEHAALFVTHIRQAATAVLRHLFLDDAEKPRYETVKKRYEAYAGALWAGVHRYELEVSYFSVTGTDDLRILMTAAVKYAENKIRAYLSVKSRLSVSCLPDKYRALLDAYFDAALPILEKKRVSETERPTYEALYDAPSEGVSPNEATKIEENSWENTWRLIPEEEKEEIFASTPSPPTPVPQTVEDAGTEDAPFLTEDELTFLSLLAQGKGGEARAYTKTKGLSYLALGERVNEVFSDRMGDIVLELSGEEYIPIEDYENEIRSVLSAHGMK